MSKIEQEFEKDELMRKLSMQDVADAFSLWKVAAENAWMDKLPKAEEICRQALKYSWGNESVCEFNYQKQQLVCKGPSGEFYLFE